MWGQLSRDPQQKEIRANVPLPSQASRHAFKMMGYLGLEEADNAVTLTAFLCIAPQAPEDLKKDGVIAVEKSLESKAWAQLWTLRITVSLGGAGDNSQKSG